MIIPGHAGAREREPADASQALPVLTLSRRSVLVETHWRRHDVIAGVGEFGRLHAMMRQYELVERVRRYNPRADEDVLNRAYVFAMKAHGSQKRASGDPISPIRSKWRPS